MVHHEAEILRSKLDRSINVVSKSSDGGMIESRFVQRTDDTIIVYLSSSTGCSLACRFCHLTQTRQTMDRPVGVADYLEQAQYLLAMVNQENKLEGVKTVHFNFMARGDCLNNHYFVGNTASVIEGLVRIAQGYGLSPKFKISTIFPTTAFAVFDDKHLKSWVFETLALHPEIEFYYSLYSLNPQFRKRWIPRAIDPSIVGDIFKDTINKVRIHHAIIKGENSSFEDVLRIHRWLIEYNIHARFNLVRYNPFGDKSGTEPDIIKLYEYLETMKKSRYITSAQIISRVGGDVAASCGQFIS